MSGKKQKITISLSSETVRKAKLLAAKSSISMKDLLAKEIELLIGKDNAYERARQQALMLLATGFHLGGKSAASRDSLHNRNNSLG